ncbi:MAG: helix-turn-helix transcriptional regulator [Bacteroidetes bacterium]|nr:helix-turn-helix transcriptional regulator [Bacteroidota bacterium]HET6243582.1 helix-turn-helix transcriptional regulator [Bacteroidia bacterium]
MNTTRNKEYIIAFGEQIRKLRKEKSMSMEKLAEQADIEYSQIAKIEKGKINTTISTVFNLANALQLPVEDLFKFDFTSSKKQ